MQKAEYNDEMEYNSRKGPLKTQGKVDLCEECIGFFSYNTVIVRPWQLFHCYDSVIAQTKRIKNKSRSSRSSKDIWHSQSLPSACAAAECSSVSCGPGYSPLHPCLPHLSHHTPCHM